MSHTTQTMPHPTLLIPEPSTPRVGTRCYRNPFAADGYNCMPAGHEFTFSKVVVHQESTFSKGTSEMGGK